MADPPFFAKSPENALGRHPRRKFSGFFVPPRVSMSRSPVAEVALPRGAPVDLDRFTSAHVESLQ
jgi:hypothetical protein